MKMKIDPTQHLTIAQYSADLSADGMVDPMLTDALNALGGVGKLTAQFGNWTGAPATNNESVVVLTGTLDTVNVPTKMLEVIANSGESLILNSGHSLYVGLLGAYSYRLDRATHDRTRRQ